MNTKGQLLGAGREAEVYAWGESDVLKLFRPGFGGAQSEARLTQAAHAAGAQAPAVRSVVQVEGREGILFERIEGRSLLALLLEQPERAETFTRWLAEAHAQMHACRVPDLPPARARLAHRIRVEADLPPELRDAALRALACLPDGDQLLHGDFHPDNVLVSRHGLRVIDWVGATRGHPPADVARTLLLIRGGDPPPGMIENDRLQMLREVLHAGYLARYFEQRPEYALAQVEAWALPVAAARLAEGIASERERLLARVRELAREV